MISLMGCLLARFKYYFTIPKVHNPSKVLLQEKWWCLVGDLVLRHPSVLLHGGTSSWMGCVAGVAGLGVWPVIELWGIRWMHSHCLLGTGSSDHTESSSTAVGNLLHCWSPFLMEVSCWRLIISRLLGGGATLPFFSLVWMKRWDSVSPCSPWGWWRPQLLIPGKCVQVS